MFCTLCVVTVELLTLACCALHNFLSREGEEEQHWDIINLTELEKSSGNRSSDEASDILKKL
ncbi:hypothetical protein CVS40_4898 [Lucilia cuprina]|nr:hypothetical protein CVS40_4898 [Lucilia cuprina]